MARYIYTNRDLHIFKIQANKYLLKYDDKKTMGDLCDYLGITRKTLSKYKQRGSAWSESIDDIKTRIKKYNRINETILKVKKIERELDQLKREITHAQVEPDIKEILEI